MIYFSLCLYADHSFVKSWELIFVKLFQLLQGVVAAGEGGAVGVVVVMVMVVIPDQMGQSKQTLFEKWKSCSWCGIEHDMWMPALLVYSWSWQYLRELSFVSRKYNSHACLLACSFVISNCGVGMFFQWFWQVFYSLHTLEKVVQFFHSFCFYRNNRAVHSFILKYIFAC